MSNDIKRGSLANTLALHDFKRTPLDVKGWFYYVEDWFQKHTLTPTKMDITGDKTVEVKGNSTIKFITGKKRLEKYNFEGVHGMWIAALPPDEKVGTEMFDFIFSAHLRMSLRMESCILCWDDQIDPFRREIIESLVKDLYAFFEPAYGYAYQRLFKQGPSFYPFGMMSGIDMYGEESDRITSWGNTYGCLDGGYETGMFRDIYPFNFIREEHFKIKVEGKTLDQWIEKDSSRGELRQLAPRLWSWWIEEKNIEAVRQALIPTHMLVAYRERKTTPRPPENKPEQSNTASFPDTIRQELLDKLSEQTGESDFLPVLSYDDFMTHSFTLSSIAANQCDDEDDLEEIRSFLEELRHHESVLDIWFGVVDEDVFEEGEQDYLYAENVHIVGKEPKEKLERFLQKKGKRLDFEFKEGFFYGQPESIEVPEDAYVFSLVWD